MRGHGEARVREWPAKCAVCNPRFRFGHLRRAGQNPDAFRLEHGVERIGELACAVPDQELDCSGALAEVHQDVAGCLCRPRAVGMRGDAGEMDAAGLVFDDDQDVEATEQHGVHVDEVGREDPAGLGGQELVGAENLRHLG